MIPVVLSSHYSHIDSSRKPLKSNLRVFRNVRVYQNALKESKGEHEIELEEYGLGFDYVFKRVPTVSFYQILLFIMSNWIFFCAGFTQVGSGGVLTRTD